jgi:hypothetical protein
MIDDNAKPGSTVGDDTVTPPTSPFPVFAGKKQSYPKRPIDSGPQLR